MYSYLVVQHKVNIGGHFITYLPQDLRLDGEWKVAFTEIRIENPTERIPRYIVVKTNLIDSSIEKSSSVLILRRVYKLNSEFQTLCYVPVIISSGHLYSD